MAVSYTHLDVYKRQAQASGPVIAMPRNFPFLRSADQDGTAAATAPELAPDSLIIVPVRNFVLFPGAVFPVTIGRPRSVAAAQEAVRQSCQIGFLMQRDAEMQDPSALDLHRTGTIANVLRYVCLLYTSRCV